MPATIEHVSDIVLHAWGTTPKEVFRNALGEMNEVLKPGACNGARHSDYCTRIQVESPDTEALLLDFLSGVLALSLIQKSLFCYVYFEHLDRRCLSARLFGRWYKDLEKELMAVTHTELRRNTNGIWVANISCVQ